MSWWRPGAADERRPSAVLAGALVVHTLVGLAPLAFELGRVDSFVLPVWWALVALPLGVDAGARGALLWPFGLLPPVAWMLGYGFAELALDEPAPTPAWAGLAAAGLWALGIALGRSARARPWPAVALALLVSAAAVALPVRLGAPRRVWAERSPRVAALLLDASPAALLTECAGLDWMRHRATYQPAGTDWYSDHRAPYRGALAGPGVFVLGCALAWAVRRRARA